MRRPPLRVDANIQILYYIVLIHKVILLKVNGLRFNKKNFTYFL